MNIVLASASPRRQELLGRITSNFEIIVSNFDESSVEYNGNVCEYVNTLAVGKGKEVLEQIDDHSIIIACDTIVYYDGKILGKPKDNKEAFLTLKMLSNNTHYVYSSIALIDSVTKETKVQCIVTEVKFMELTEKMINEYIATGEPLDKAGAYGIQGKGAVFVESINGCYYNVVGLSINKLYSMLREMGVNL